MTSTLWNTDDLYSAILATLAALHMAGYALVYSFVKNEISKTTIMIVRGILQVNSNAVHCVLCLV